MKLLTSDNTDSRTAERLGVCAQIAADRIASLGVGIRLLNELKAEGFLLFQKENALTFEELPSESESIRWEKAIRNSTFWSKQLRRPKRQGKKFYDSDYIPAYFLAGLMIFSAAISITANLV